MSRPIALVTGPTSGIGLSFARRLAALGHDLVLVARDRERLERLGSELGSLHGTTVEVIVADLGDRRQLAAVEGRLADPGRPVDLLVNNAGYGLQGSFLDHSVEDEQRLLDVLVTAVLRLMHAALGPMVQRGSGTIVNVSSVVGYLPRGSYSAAKGYVTSLSEWADLTYRHRGVHVMALLPGVHPNRVPRPDGRPAGLRSPLAVAGRGPGRRRRADRPRQRPPVVRPQQALPGAGSSRRAHPDRGAGAGAGTPPEVTPDAAQSKRWCPQEGHDPGPVRAYSTIARWVCSPEDA
jgi:uncharacterized protein